MVSSAPGIFLASLAGVGGAIIRHFNFDRNRFVILARTSELRDSTNIIDKTIEPQQALHLKA